MRIKKYYKLYRVDYEDTGYFYIKNIDTQAGVLTLSREFNVGRSIEYSTDGVNWVPTNGVAAEVSVSPGNNVYLRGTFKFDNAEYGTRINADFKHSANGNILSVYDKDSFADITDLSKDISLYCLFYNNTNLIEANFNIGNLTHISGMYAFNNVFKGCTNLQKLPDFSGITDVSGSNAFNNAFYDCSNLVESPDFSGITNVSGSYAFQQAFLGCSNLVESPDFSGITNVSGSYAFHQAFYGCSRLKTIHIPNISNWNTDTFNGWVASAGTQAETPKQMIFQTQELMDACPSGSNGYGNYTKILA